MSKLSLSKVPEVTLGFWIIKIIATTLGEVGGNAVSLTFEVGSAQVRNRARATKCSLG